MRIETSQSKEIIDITKKIQVEVEAAKVTDGVVHLFVLHTTASLTVADLDPGTDLDFLDFLQKIVPQMKFRHPHDPEHTPEHLLSSIIGPDVTIPIQKGKLVLGTWQSIVLVELSGPRKREIQITFLPGDSKI